VRFARGSVCTRYELDMGSPGAVARGARAV
jgi:hypothetical protein